MFLFFYTICFATELPLYSAAEELGMTERQAISVIRFDEYDSRMLPVFQADFRRELGSNDITSSQVHEFIGKVFLLLVAYDSKNPKEISQKEMDATHPLATFYNQLKTTAIEKIKQQ